jgi:disulfide oxidoreductase YuzD
MKKNISIFFYGTEQICGTCMNLPSSKDTCEWLEAAVLRKFPHQSFTFEYIDIFSPPNDELKKEMAARVMEEDLFYPVVFIENQIVAEGNPRLKTILQDIEKYTV